MKSILKNVVCFFAVFLVGCAGTNFERPKQSEFVLGTTTPQEIKARFGKPFNTTEVQKNDVAIQIFNYAFATMDWGSLKPARGQSFSFCEGKLVGYQFISSFAKDSTDFDGGKVAAIKQNVSTRSDVEKLLGPPSGRLIYPLVTNRNDEAYCYVFNQVRGVPFGVKTYNKSLQVTFNHEGIVTDVAYVESGER